MILNGFLGNSRSRSHQNHQHNQHHHQHAHHQMQLHQHQHPNSIPASVHVELFDQHQGTHILQSLDGFAFSLGSDGRFLYISETVSIYLGLSQVEMTGSSVFDYVHTADHAELAQQLGLTLATNQAHHSASSSGTSSSQQLPPSPASGTGSVDDGSCCMNPDGNTAHGELLIWAYSFLFIYFFLFLFFWKIVTSLMSLESNSAYQGLDRSFCIRMKSTLTKRGCHFKSSGYRVLAQNWFWCKWVFSLTTMSIFLFLLFRFPRWWWSCVDFDRKAKRILPANPVLGNRTVGRQARTNQFLYLEWLPWPSLYHRLPFTKFGLSRTCLLHA